LVLDLSDSGPRNRLGAIEVALKLAEVEPKPKIRATNLSAVARGLCHRNLFRHVV
jgi:hypothetical protein